MTNALGIDYAADAGEMMDDAGQTCTINGGDAIKCAAGAEVRNVLIDDANDVVVYDRDCMIKLSEVGNIPSMHALVAINGVTYALIDLSTDRDEGVIVMTLRRNQDQ